MTPAQIRAARAWLDWQQADLAREAGLSTAVIKVVERARRPVRASTLKAIRDAFARAGVTWSETERNFHLVCERR